MLADALTGKLAPRGAATAMSFRAAWDVYLTWVAINRVKAYRQREHIVGTVLVNAGERLEVVSRLLGHSTVAVTQRSYAHLATEATRASVDVLADVLGPTCSPDEARERIAHAKRERAEMMRPKASEPLNLGDRCRRCGMRRVDAEGTFETGPWACPACGLGNAPALPPAHAGARAKGKK